MRLIAISSMEGPGCVVRAHATSSAYGVVSRTFARSAGSFAARSVAYVSFGRNWGNSGFNRPRALAYGEAATGSLLRQQLANPVPAQPKELVEG